MEIENCEIVVPFLQSLNDLFNTADLFMNRKNLSFEEIVNGAKFTHAWLNFAVIWSTKSESAYFLHDQANLLEFRSLKMFNSYFPKYYNKHLLNMPTL